MSTRAKVIVQFRKNGQRVTTKTIKSETGALSDFDAVLTAENILNQLVDRRSIPALLLDYDAVRINNCRDFAVSGDGRNKGAFGVLSKNRSALIDARAYLKR